MAGYDKPLPIIDEDSRPYWEAAKRHELMMPRCNDCGKFVFYPRIHCPHCKGTSLTWQKLSGRGTIYSYTVPRVPITPAYKDSVPYVVALIDLDEGPRMMANIIDCDPEQVSIGARVEVVFQDVTDEVTLPQFRLV